jgi:hypothetical protein
MVRPVGSEALGGAAGHQMFFFWPTIFDLNFFWWIRRFAKGNLTVLVSPGLFSPKLFLIF